MTSWHVPGLGYEENCLPTEQAGLGNDVAIVTSDRLPPLMQDRKPDGLCNAAGRIRPETNRQGGVFIIRLPSTPPVYGQLVLLGLSNALKRLEPDVVHAHGAFSPTTIQCLLRQKHLGFRLFVDDHTHSRNLTLDTKYKRSYVKALAWAYRCSDASVAAYLPITSAAVPGLRRQLEIRADRLVEVPLGADSTLFTPCEEKRRTFRSRFPLTEGEAIVACTGKFTREKEIDVLIRAFATVVAKFSGSRLILAGTIHPSYRAQLQELAMTLGVGTKIAFRDLVPRSELAEFYNGVDIGVWPGTPSITVIEALACGLACVLPGNVPAYRLVEQYGACLTFPEGDPIGLATSIMTLLGSPSSRTTVTHNARRLTEERLSWTAIAKQTLGIYDAYS